MLVVIERLDRTMLLSLAPSDVKDELTFGIDIDTVVRRLNFGLQMDNLVRKDALASIVGKEKPYWTQVKAEIHRLICTNDPRYESVRIKFRETKGPLGTSLVASLSALVGSAIGVSAAIALPLCALALYAVISVGVGAYCNLPSPTASDAGRR